MEYRIGRAGLGLTLVVGVVLGIDSVSSESEAAVGAQQPAVTQDAESPYRNVQIFGELPPDRLRFVMQVYSNVLGTECEHCHVVGEWHLDDKPAKVTARSMVRMVISSSATHFEGIGSASCWTCHRGDITPALNPDEATMAEFMANSPPIPGPSPFSDEERPSGEVYRNVQQYGNIPANRLVAVMQAYSASLGVGCDHCHVTGDWASDVKPTKRMARRMFDIRTGMQDEFFEGEQVLSCWTCHRGEAKAQTNPPPEMLPPRGDRHN